MHTTYARTPACLPLRHCKTEYNDGGGYTRFCAGDEHYKQTLLVLHGRESEIERRQARARTMREALPRQQRCRPAPPLRPELVVVDGTHQQLSPHHHLHPWSDPWTDPLLTDGLPPQVTWANWKPLGRAHPKLYAVQEVDEALIRELHAMRAAPHPAEEVGCGTWADPETGEEGAPRPCWLFARKFTPRGAERILTFSREVIGF